MQEKLQKIKAKCQELLELGKERTQGTWWDIETRDGDRVIRTGNPTHTGIDICEVYSHDSEFIASCAGPAEAGWRATIAAIDEMGDYYSDMEMRGYYNPIVNAIISAWPDELLK